MTVIGIYLAAGNSRRMGMNKLLLDMEGTPLGSLALQTALTSAIHHILVITKKSETSWIAPFLFAGVYRKKWTSVQLKKSNQGLAYSIKCGLYEAENLHADAVLLQLADQPFVTAEMINLLIGGFREESSQLFFACKYQGIIRPPVLFTKDFFPILMKLEGDKGASDLLNGEYRAKGKIVNFENGDSFLDIDTMKDYLIIRQSR